MVINKTKGKANKIIMFIEEELFRLFSYRCRFVRWNYSLILIPAFIVLVNIPCCHFYARALLPTVTFSRCVRVTSRSKFLPSRSLASLFTVYPRLWLLQRSWRSWRACRSLAAWRDGRSQQERDSGKNLYCTQSVERRGWWALWRGKMGIRQKVRELSFGPMQTNWLTRHA